MGSEILIIHFVSISIFAIVYIFLLFVAGYLLSVYWELTTTNTRTARKL